MAVEVSKVGLHGLVGLFREMFYRKKGVLHLQLLTKSQFTPGVLV